MRIKSKAPARIDLAGGTLDLWPLYLFFENAGTLNMAIDQYAEVEIEVAKATHLSGAGHIELRSDDRQLSVTLDSFAQLVESYHGTHRSNLPSGLWLHAKVLRHFFGFWKTPGPIAVKTRCASPAGAGLGGSSALNVALCVAMRALTQANYDDAGLLRLARDLETTIIDVPAGVQDYWSALYGGVNLIRMEAGRKHRKSFYKQKEFLEKHVVLCYSGQSRNSGINNWSVYKKFIDGDQNVRQLFSRIVEATHIVEEALESFSYDKFSAGIEKEWSARKGLAEQITTTEIDFAINVAKDKGATASKICGAGGGGCFFVVTPESRRDSVVEALRKTSVQVIDFRVAEQGCSAELLTS